LLAERPAGWFANGKTPNLKQVVVPSLAALAHDRIGVNPTEAPDCARNAQTSVEVFVSIVYKSSPDSHIRCRFGVLRCAAYTGSIASDLDSRNSDREGFRA
jgi:hypothetical protein